MNQSLEATFPWRIPFVTLNEIEDTEGVESGMILSLPTNREKERAFRGSPLCGPGKKKVDKNLACAMIHHDLGVHYTEPRIRNEWPTEGRT